MAYAFITMRTWLAASLPSRDDDQGASLVEYALLLALIAAVCIVAVTVLGGKVNSSYSSTGSSFSN